MYDLLKYVLLCFFKSSLEGRLRETLHKDYVKKLRNINIAYFQFSNIEAKAENT